MVDPTIRERLREHIQTWRDGAQQRHDRWEHEHEWDKADSTDGEILAFDEVIVFLDTSPLALELDTLERRAIVATEALERLSDVGWVLARITSEGERIDPPSGTWHDLDAALEQARAALEASRGSA